MQKFNQVDNYILDVCNQIRSKRAHKAVAKEIVDHIEDQKNAFILEGQNEESAIDNAIKEMGNPITVGEQLDKIHRPKPEKSIIITVIALVLLQLLSVNFTKHINFELGEYLVSITVGIAVMATVYFIDYSRIMKYSTFIYIGICLVNILLNNDRIVLSKTAVLLDYYFTLIIIVAFSGVIINFKNKGYKGYAICFTLFVFGIITNFIISNASCLLIFCIGSGVLILCACIKNVFKVNKKVIILSIGFVFGFLAICGLIQIITSRGYVYDQLKFIINPYKYGTNGGYVRVLIREALTNVKFIGEAILPNRFSGSLEVIPNIDTDYGLTYFIAKFGYIVGIIVVSIIAFLTIRMFISTFKQKNQQGMFISLGCSIVILIQVVFYILANFGYEIVGTISLPLLSYGKAGFITNMLIIGIMLCTYRNDDIVERK